VDEERGLKSSLSSLLTLKLTDMKVFIFIMFLVINQSIKAQNLYMSETLNNIKVIMETAESSDVRYETVYFSGDILRTRKMQYRELDQNCRYFVAIVPDKRLEKLSLTIYANYNGTHKQITYEVSSNDSNICLTELKTNDLMHFVFQIDALRFKEGFEVCQYGLIIVRVNSKN
jgi:hypothetical protein